jgi:tetratricopeptide (TPR) repeat protein
VYHKQGLYDQALENYQQALIIIRDVGGRAGEGTTLNNIGAVYHKQGLYDQALENYQQALIIARALGLRTLEESILSSIADLSDY